ncbi:MAG: bifunctional serine/threonine-protein kinase/formylglycine-generating enzyme family protein [Planctomycetota bacterium]
MGADDWPRVRALFEQVVALPEERRAGALDQGCAGDRALRREVEGLLAADGATRELTRVGAARWAQLVALPAPEALLGRELGGFRLTRVIGRGGVGIVFQAEQEHPRRTVAVKLLAGGAFSADARRRFEYEAQVLARLQHPGVAQVFASGTHLEPADGRELPWIAMERVEAARTLTDYAEAEQLGVAERVELLRAACSAVQHGHRRGVIHRDLKPGNVLVDVAGRVKVIDFGIARVAEEGALTREGTVVGTVQHMAPEQLRGEPVDVRCDVYALGVLLYELVARQLPHDLADKPVPEAYRLLVDTAPAPPSSRRPGLAHELDWICAKALEGDREARYSSVEAFDADLARFLRQEPLVAGPAGAVYRARKFVRRHRVGVAATALVLALAGAGLAAHVAGILRADREHQKMVRLADARHLARLRAGAEALYPAHPHLLSDLDEWLAAARRLEARLPRHREVLDELEARAVTAPAQAGAGWEFAEDTDAWWHAALAELLADFESFFEPGTGLVADVARRRRDAATLVERTLDGPAAQRAWEQACATLADPERSPAYAGLQLAPQLGLVPLGADPDSGLWEFLVELSGAAPQRAPDGRLQLSADAGVVLVLVPAGSFTPFDVEDRAAPLESYEELPLEPRRVDPLFVSKWELTQAQWTRLAGGEPSASSGATHPVERVSWEECDLWLRRAGLALPSVAEWNYAALGGRPGRWWMDPLPSDLAARACFGQRALHLPCGSFPPNPFGLHDMLGNVEEWCSDAHGDGSQRAFRGGAFYDPPEWFRIRSSVSWRQGEDPRSRHSSLGVRAVRPLDREPFVRSPSSTARR